MIFINKLLELISLNKSIPLIVITGALNPIVTTPNISGPIAIKFISFCDLDLGLTIKSNES
jgi:hypothetical protein